MRVLLLGLLLVIPLPLAAAGKCPVPKKLNFVAENMIRRDTPGFTEGLEVHDGAIYESTGNVFGDSRINRIDPKTGRVTALVNAGKSYFGEGMTFFAGKLYQMTWREHRVFVFDQNMRKLPELSNPREGWGLTNDGTSLIFSDGTPSFFFADPQTFAITREVKIKSDGPGEVAGLNELELIDGKLYGNLFQTQTIVRIDPASGCVEARANMGSLWRSFTEADKKQVMSEENVLNGIAYDKATGLFYVTGKRWRTIFVGRFGEQK